MTALKLLLPVTPRPCIICFCVQLFRTAQLTVTYLLHVQDRLAADCCAAKVGAECIDLLSEQALRLQDQCQRVCPVVQDTALLCHPEQNEVARLKQQAQLHGLKRKELQEELAGSRKEARHLRKSLRTLEVSC